MVLINKNRIYDMVSFYDIQDLGIEAVDDVVYFSLHDRKIFHMDTVGGLRCTLLGTRDTTVINTLPTGLSSKDITID